jgi:hypothetical protein
MPTHSTEISSTVVIQKLSYKVAQAELGWSAAWGMSGLHSQRDVIG